MGAGWFRVEDLSFGTRITYGDCLIQNLTPSFLVLKQEWGGHLEATIGTPKGSL